MRYGKWVGDHDSDCGTSVIYLLIPGVNMMSVGDTDERDVTQNSRTGGVNYPKERINVSRVDMREP